MQLALFNIQTDDAASKGKAGKATGKTGKAAADGTNKATQNSRDDFLTSLRMVSKRNRENPDDMSAAASGSGQTPDGEHLARLGDILNEIMREWPTCKRPIGSMVAGNELPGDATHPDATAKAGWGLALVEPGKGRQGIALARRATAGFTTALIKRPNGAQVETGHPTTVAGKTVSLDTVAADRATLPTGKPGKGNGVSILSMTTVQSAGADAMSLKGVDAEALHQDEKVTEKSVARQHLSALNNGPRKAVGQTVPLKAAGEQTVPLKAAGEQTVSLKAAGENTALEKDRQIPVDLKAKTARPAAAGKTPAVESHTVKAAPVKDVTVDSKLSARTSNSAGAATPSQKSAVETVAVFKPDMEGTTPGQARAAGSHMAATALAAEQTPDSKPSGGEQAARLTSAAVGAAGSAKAPGTKRNGPELQKISDDRGGEGLRQLVGREGTKSPAAMEREGALNSDVTLAEKERFGSDSTIGQAARDQKGGDQPRFEAADARVKAADTVGPTPKSQPVSPSALPSDPEKPILDRVAQARVLEQITAKMKIQPKKGGSEIRIHLKPEALGQLQLKVLAQEQNVTVKMVAETAMARDIIENNIGQLRADLNALGLNVEKLDVDVFTTNDPGDKHSAEQRGSHSGNGRGAAQHGSRDGDLSERARQMHVDADEADGGTLIGVFA